MSLKIRQLRSSDSGFDAALQQLLQWSAETDQGIETAVQAIVEDPNVRALQEKFGARVNPASIRSKV